MSARSIYALLRKKDSKKEKKKSRKDAWMWICCFLWAEQTEKDGAKTLAWQGSVIQIVISYNVDQGWEGGTLMRVTFLL